MLYILAGKSNSGKSTIAQAMSKLGYERIKSYTTRPRRANNVQDVLDYEFTSKELLLNNLDMFFSHKQYEVASGEIYHYAFKKSDFNNIRNKDYIIIADPNGTRELRKKFPDDTFVIFINADFPTRFERGLMRNDDIDELRRRLDKDEEDFEGFEFDLQLVNNTEADFSCIVTMIKRLLLEVQ